MSERVSGPGDLPFDKEWMAAYFAEVDRLDPDGLMAWYAPNGSFRFANAPAVIGHDAIKRTLAGFYGSIRSMRHENTGAWVDDAGRSGVWEAVAHFVTADGREVALPAVSVLRLKDGLVHDFRFVMDAGPLQGAAS